MWPRRSPRAPSRARGGRGDRRGSSRPPLPILPAVQGSLAHLGRALLAADVDLDRRSGGRRLARDVAHADPLLEARRECAARDDPGALVGTDLISRSRDAWAGEGEGHEELARLEVAYGVRADESRVQLAAPIEAGLDRVAVLGEVVAVEVEADL